MYSSTSSGKEEKEEVLFSKTNRIGHILLNRPKQFNALTENMCKLMRKQLTEFEKDSGIDAVVIKGSGEKAFCAGGDIKAIRESFIASGTTAGGFDFFEQEYILNNQIAEYSKPYVALLNGITMGGGVGVSQHGRFRVATDKTVFAMPETAIGFFADVGASFFLSRLPEGLGLYLLLTGHRLKGADVKRVGLSTHYMNSSRLPELEQALADAATTQTPIDSVLDKFDDKSIEADQFDLTNIQRNFSETSLDAIYSNLEKENSEWSNKQLTLLNKWSPTSMQVGVRQLQLGKKKTLKECFEMEFVMAQKFAERGDFLEGVRTVLIDRGDTPIWNPSSYKDVDQKAVDFFFDFDPARNVHINFKAKL